MNPVLKVSGLRRVFGRGDRARVAVDDVTLSLGRGDSLAIVGESGSGKTTVARIVAGLETPTSGEVVIGGQRADWPRRFRHYAREVQMVFQDPYGSLDPRQEVGSAIGELLRQNFSMRGAAVRSKTSQLLESVGLPAAFESRLPRELSGGQRQRVAIARALALEPRILILDEAVSALDVSIQAQILNLLSDIRAETGISYLFISHDLAVVRQVADHCLVMNAGRVVESGPTDRVLDDPQEPYTRALLDAVPRPGWQPRRRTNQITPSIEAKGH